MYNQIAVKLQKMDSFAYDNFRPEELDIALNDAQYKFIKSRLSMRHDPKQAGFEKNQKRLNDLRDLIEPWSEDLESVHPGNGEETAFELPEDFFVEVSTKGLVSRNEVHYQVPVRIVENERFDQDMQNPFRQPTSSSLPGYIAGNKLVIKPKEKDILLGLRGTYVRIPKKIDLSSDCELPQYTHPEIVDLAVTQLLEVLESKRYQTSKIEASQSD